MNKKFQSAFFLAHSGGGQETTLFKGGQMLDSPGCLEFRKRNAINKIGPNFAQKDLFSMSQV